MTKILRALMGSIPIILLAASRLSAQEEPARNPEAPLPQFQILETKVTQLPGRKITIHRVADPGLPAPTPPVPVASPAVLLPPLTPEQLAARRVAAPKETRVLLLTVTHYADNLSYIEWCPRGDAAPFGAWSNADFNALRMVPDVEISPGDIRWIMFPFFISKATLPGPVALPQLPTDGLGFIVVKGDPADVENVNPIAALHKIYKEKGAELTRVWEERERERLQEETRLAALPPASKDEVLYIWKAKPIRKKGGAK